MLGLSFSTVGLLSLVLGFRIIKEEDPHQASALLAVQMVFWAIGLLDCEVVGLLGRSVVRLLRS